MKKMWKLNNKAVSPVIATILMVAITVVLAAVLYVMVMGFGGNDQNAPSAVLGTPDVTTTTATISIVSISPETDLVDLEYKLNASGSLVALTNTSFIDIAEDDQASAGDFFDLGSLTSGVTYTLYLIYTPTGDVIDSVAFTTA